MTVDQAGEEIKKIKNTFKNLQSFFKNLPVKFPYLSFHMQSRQTTKSDSILYILRIHHLTAEHTSHIDLHFGMWPNSVTKLKCKKKKKTLQRCYLQHEYLPYCKHYCNSSQRFYHFSFEQNAKGRRHRQTFLGNLGGVGRWCILQLNTF